MSIQSDGNISNAGSDPREHTWSDRLPRHLSETKFSSRFARQVHSGTADLRTSNPTDVELTHRRDTLSAYRDAVDNDNTEVYTPTDAGLPAARESISEYYAARGADVDPADIILCASTSEAYSWLAKLLAEPGDAIAVPNPSYPLFDHLLRLESVRRIPYPVTYDGRWHTDIGALRATIENHSVRAVIDVSPNNPTGHRLRGEPLNHIAATLVSSTTPLIVDEVFVDYNRQTGHASGILAELQTRPAAERPPTFVLSGLSKLAGLPGAKLGWIVLDGPTEWRRDARKRLRYIADTYLSVTTLAQSAAPAVLRTLDAFQDELNTRLAEHTRRLRALTDDIPVASRQSGAHGWYELVRLPHTQSSRAVALHLAESHDVALQPGFLYDLPETTLVTSLLPPNEVFREGVKRLRRGLIELYDSGPVR